MVYIKITVPGQENGFITTAEDAKSAIDEMVLCAEEGNLDRSFEFRAVELSVEEFESLPEFRGF